MKSTLIAIASLLLVSPLLQANEAPPEGWTFESARDEIRPTAAWLPHDGPNADGDPKLGGVFEILRR